MSFGTIKIIPYLFELTKRILSREVINQEKSILDVGCGTGQTSSYIAEKYRCSVTSLDHNKTMLEKAKQRFLSLKLDNVNIVHGSVEKLPFDNESFDFILSESVTSFTKIPIAIKEFKRVLKPKGVLLAIEMVLDDTLSEEETKRFVDFYGVSQLLTQLEWYSLFQKAGFKKISSEKFYYKQSENMIDSVPDFILSEEINERLFEILEKHERLTKAYMDRLAAYVFRCCI